MVMAQAAGFWLYDLGSANGTELNGRQMDQPTQLRHGDIIVMADITFEFHVPEEAGEFDMAAITESPMTVIGVRKTPMLILVTDIVDFSGLSERLTEEGLAAVLNVWYDQCRTIMDETGGTIDKFMGDGMFGYWKTTTPEARANALEAARRVAAGLETHGEFLRCGVGLHIGEAAAGAVTRGERTVLGDAVNIAFRIESLTRGLQQSVLASSAFFDGWGTGLSMFSSVGTHELKGYTEPVELFALNS